MATVYDSNWFDNAGNAFGFQMRLMKHVNERNIPKVTKYIKVLMKAYPTKSCDSPIDTKLVKRAVYLIV